MSSNQFDHMIGKTYTYMAREYVIKEIQVQGSECVVVTDKKNLRVSLRELKSEFLEVETEDANQFKVVVYKGLGDQQGSIKVATDALVAALKKVEADPTYIPQAKVIADISKVIIHAGAVSVNAAKVARDISRG